MKRWPLIYIIPGVIFLLAGSLMVALSAFEIRKAYERAEQTISRQSQILGTVLAAGIETAFRHRDLSEARSIFVRANGDRDLDLAVLINDKDDIIFSTRLTLRGRSLASTSLSDLSAISATARTNLAAQLGVNRNDELVVTAIPVRLTATSTASVGGQTGVLLLRHRLGYLRRAAMRDALEGLAVLGVSLIVACLVIWLALRKLVIARILALADAADQLLRDESDIAVDTDGADELAGLARTIDATGRRIRDYTAELKASHSFLDQALNAVPANIAVLDSTGTIVSVNKSWREFAAENDLHMHNDGIGTNYVTICEKAGDVARPVVEGFRKIARGQLHEFHIDYDCHSPHEQRWFELRMSGFEANGEVQIIMSHHNVSAVHESMRVIREGEARYRTLYNNNPAMFFTVGADNCVASANDFGARQLGYQVADLIGVNIALLYAEEQRVRVLEQLDACRKNQSQVLRWDIEKIRKDGSHFHARETGRGVVDEHGRQNVLVVCEDVTEAVKLSRELEYRATHDALTGLINRFEFEHRLEDAVDSARSTDVEHVLCYCDLDQFKVINDTCGHVAGDELLRQLSQRFQSKIRRHDTLARLGGDEFALLMEHCPLDRGEALAEAFRAEVEDFRFTWESRTFSIGVSIGVVAIDTHTLSVAELLSAADAACYAAKDAGRNRIHVLRGDDENVAQRRGEMHWAAEIQSAIDDSRFELWYQPILPLGGAGGHLWHYELLLRMREVDGQLVTPGSLLPAAERYDLAARIDRWVIDAAFDWLGAHPRHLHELARCSINLSGQSLGADHFIDHVLRRIESSAVPADKICFEITETAAISNLATAMTFMKRVNELGCSFALDDFGSGLSSFAYLKHLPVRFLKIDGQFVRDMDTDPIDAAMVNSINDIGHVIGHQTIAEFVESPAILERIVELGVDYAQGYGIARPAPLEELLHASPPLLQAPTKSPVLLHL